MGKAVFRPDIEGLRAVAVLGVMAFHFGVFRVTGGFVGVDAFFVISGYLITGILISELEIAGHIDLLRFYGRRARRLLPALVVVTVVVLIAGFFILSPLEECSTAKSALSSSLYLSNFWFVRQVFDYFAPENATNAFLHTWTLSVEEQFYLLWPALLLFAQRFRKVPFKMPLVMGTITLFSFVICLWLTHTRQPWAFYSSPARAWEFGIGGLASLAPVTQRMRSWRGSAALGWLGFIALIGSFFVIDKTWAFPGWTAVWPAMASVAILLSGANLQRNGPIILLRTSPFQWVGRHSYSIYLWHWPILVFARIIHPEMSAEVKVACAILTICCAAVSFSLLEHPVRTSPWLIAKNLRSVGLGAGLSFCSAVLALVMLAVAHQFSTRPLQKLVADQAATMPIASRVPGCVLNFTDYDPVSCAFGDLRSNDVFVLFGDSHADEWSSPLADVAKRNGWRMVTYLKSSCSVADIPVYNIRLRRISPECRKWRDAVLEDIAKLHPAAVVIGEFSSGYILGQMTGLGEHAVSFDTWSSGMGRILNRFRILRIPVVLIRDNPTPMRNEDVCLSRALWHHQTIAGCHIPRDRALDVRVTRAEYDMTDVASDSRLIDLSDKICGATICPAMIGGTVVYRDGNHLTNMFASRFERQFEEALLPIMARQSSRGPDGSAPR